jgi:hypothetical protein
MRGSKVCLLAAIAKNALSGLQYSALYNVLYTVHCIMCCTLYTVLYTVHCIMCCTLYTVLYTVHCIMCTV